MKQSVRRALLFILLAATVAAAIWPDNEEPGAVRPRRQRIDPTTAPTARKADANAGVAETTASALPDRLDGDAAGADPFGVKSWAPPPSPPVMPAAAAPVAAPSAPPLPFTYAGRLESEPGHWTIYLMRGEQSFAVSKGDVFDGVYRFDGIEDGSLLIQFLPLSITQKLQLSTEN